MNTQPEGENQPLPLSIEPTSEATVLRTVQDMTRQAMATITPQQARVGEVSEALMGAYGRASTLELSEAEIEGLLAPFDDGQVEIRPHDGLIYIPHIHISNRLNRVFRPGKWSLVCRRHWLEGGILYGEYVLLVKGCFVGESVGGHQYQPNNPKTNYSDSLESTAAEALRRICGKRLGCGAQVWDPAYARNWVATYGEQRNGKWSAKQPASPASPVAKSAPKPTPKPAPKAPATDLGAFIERCKERLVSKAQSDKQLYPYWQQYARDQGWILPNEEISAILDTITQTFRIDATKDHTEQAKAQFLAHEAAVLAMANEPAQDEQGPTEPVEIQGHADASAKGCPNCGHKAVVLSKDFDGILLCQACAWQWDVQTGDYYEEHDWQGAVCPIPPKGVKKADYDKEPMTLGQISRLDHKRFYGLVMNNQQAKPWIGRDGKQHPPSKQDEEFAIACRAAWEHMESSKGDSGEDPNPETDVPY